MQSFTIDKNDFRLGVSTSRRHTDGGFAPNKFLSGYSVPKNVAVNLFKGAGDTLYPPPTRYDINLNSSSVITGDVIAFAEDGTLSGNDSGYALDDDGKYYSIDGNTVTLRQTDSTNSYIVGTSDLVQYKGNLYGTAREDIVRLTGSSLSAIDATWWTTTRGHSALNSSYRHPMAIVEDILYIADRYYIHTWDDSASVQQAMTLPSIYNITNMIAHPDGRHLIVFCSGTANYGHSLKSKSVCFIVDTVNLEFIREISLDDQVEGSVNVGGVIYVTYGENLGYFNGDGISFLRKLSPTITGNLVTRYKHSLANVDGILAVLDGDCVLMYGDLGLGNMFWYQYADNQSVPTSPSAIAYIGSKKMLISTTDRLLDRFDLNDISGSCEWESNFYSFPSKVWIRKIEVEMETMSSGSDITFYALDKNDTATQLFTMDYATDGAISYKEKFINLRTNIFKLRAHFAAGNTKGIHKITVWYEDAE